MSGSGDDKIKLTMTGQLSYEDDITVVQAAQIISFLHAGVIPTRTNGSHGSSAEMLGMPTAQPRGVSSSPRAALDSSGARTNPEKIVALALYVGQHGGKDSFTIDDIKPLFRQAREATPGNLSRDLDAAIRSNWIVPSTEKGEYYVTDMVADVLGSGFEHRQAGRGGTAKAKSAPPRRVRRAPTTRPEAFGGVEITPTIDGYINYHQVKKKTDKYLWAINAARLWGIETVTNAEIVWLTDKLGVGISAGDVGGNFRSNFRRGFVNKNTEDKTRITPAGTDYVLSLVEGTGE